MRTLQITDTEVQALADTLEDVFYAGRFATEESRGERADWRRVALHVLGQAIVASTQSAQGKALPAVGEFCDEGKTWRRRRAGEPQTDHTADPASPLYRTVCGLDPRDGYEQRAAEERERGKKKLQGEPCVPNTREKGADRLRMAYWKSEGRNPEDVEPWETAAGAYKRDWLAVYDEAVALLCGNAIVASAEPAQPDPMHARIAHLQSELTYAAELLGTSDPEAKPNEMGTAIDALLRISRDESPIVREGAAYGLAGHHRVSSARDRLLGMANADPSPGVRDAAREALPGPAEPAQPSEPAKSALCLKCSRELTGELMAAYQGALPPEQEKRLDEIAARIASSEPAGDVTTEPSEDELDRIVMLLRKVTDGSQTWPDAARAVRKFFARATAADRATIAELRSKWVAASRETSALRSRILRLESGMDGFTSWSHEDAEKAEDAAIRMIRAMEANLERAKVDEANVCQSALEAIAELTGQTTVCGYYPGVVFEALAKLRQQHEADAKTISGLRGEVADLLARLDAAALENTQLGRERDRLRQQHDADEKTIAELRARHVADQRAITELTEERGRDAARVRELEATVDDHLRCFTQAHSERDAARAELETVKADFARYRANAESSAAIVARELETCGAKLDRRTKLLGRWVAAWPATNVSICSATQDELATDHEQPVACPECHGMREITVDRIGDDPCGSKVPRPKCSAEQPAAADGEKP